MYSLTLINLLVLIFFKGKVTMNNNTKLVSIFALLFPLIVVPNPSDYYALPRYIFLLIFSAIAFFLLFRYRYYLSHDSIYNLLFIWISVIIISSIFSTNPLTATIGRTYRHTGTSTYVALSILLVYCSQLIPKQHVSILVKQMILSAVIVAILSILQHFGFNLVPDDSYRVARSYGTLGNPNWLATYLVFIIPASIYFYISEKNRNYYFASVLMFSGLIVSGTRGCLISFVVLFTIISFMYNKQKKMLAYLVTGFMISTLVLLPTNNNIIQKRIGSIPQEITAAARLQDNAGSKRVYIWKETAKIITEYPILGVGLDNLNINMPNNVVMDKAHNIFLEILSTSGIFSFLLYASILLIIIARSRTYPVLFLMIFSYLLQGLFNNDVIMILPLFWIVLGLSLTNMQNDEGMWSTQHPRRAI